MECARELDWVAKLSLLQGFRDRDGLEWDSPRLGLIDIQWSDVRPERGLYNRLVEPRPGRAAGHRRRRSTRAVEEPPEDTRAYFRGRVPGPVRRQRRGGVVGLGDLRRARARVAAAGADAGAAAGHQGHRRRPDGPAARPPTSCWTRWPAEQRRWSTARGVTGRRRSGEGRHLERRPVEDSHGRPGAEPTTASRRRAGRGPAPETAPEAAARKEALDDDIDSMLDEIDDVLETNAEEFVRGFVQKGGQ